MTETWLKSTILDSVIHIPGYSIIRRDRRVEDHGGVCLYLKDGCFKYKQLDELSCCPDHKVLWVKLQPHRLPRGFSSLIVAVVYHPHWTTPECNLLREHLFSSLSRAESRYPNCALIIGGDFNRLDVASIKRHFRLKQIVKKPTRKDATLDLMLTNLHEYYDDPCTFPPFGLSDHSTVVAESKVREEGQNSSKYVLKHDKRESRKAELGRYLSAIDWNLLLSSTSTCEEMLNLFNEVLHTALDLLMPFKRVRVHPSDAPWMTQNLKSLIIKRQTAFHKQGADSFQFKYYRNVVNRERKVCKANFYKFKVEHLKKMSKVGEKKLSACAVRSRLHES